MALVTLTWLGGSHDFRLGIGEIRAIQQASDAGPMHVHARIISGHWFVDDLYEPIRQGLVGGGMVQSEATQLVDRLFSQHPLGEFTLTAQAVLAAAILGLDAVVEDDEPAEDEDAEPEKPVGVD
ncbi:MAG: gene transfer agent family protein [Pseudomonadota bacterium]